MDWTEFEKRLYQRMLYYGSYESPGSSDIPPDVAITLQEQYAKYKRGLRTKQLYDSIMDI